MIRDEMHEKLERAAKESGCGPVLGVLLEEAKECAYIFNVEDEGEGTQVGGSRIGGTPDLPQGVEWPSGLNEQGEAWGYASFIAQLNFAEVPELAGMPLPREGMLWLFARGMTGDTYGVGAATIYDPKPGKLRRRKEPTKREWGHHAPGADIATAIRFERGVSLRFDSEKLARAKKATKVSRVSWELRGALTPEGAKGQIGGWYNESEINPYRALAFNSLARPTYIFADYWGSVAEYEAAEERFDATREQVEWIDRHRAEIAAEAEAWELLCLFKRNISARLEIGDAVSLDFFIRPNDLAVMKFGGVLGMLL